MSLNNHDNALTFEMETAQQKISFAHLLQRAIWAHNWISFDPDKRGARFIAAAETELAADLAQIPEEAHERYRNGYERHLSSWIGALSRCASSAITGGSGFNVRRAEKANNHERSASDRLLDYRRRAIKAIQRAARAPKTVSSELIDACQKLERREALQARMKRINEAHRKYLKAPEAFDFTGFSESERDGIILYVPRYSWEPHPYAPYELTNNSAEIRRLKKRVEDLERKESRIEETPKQEALNGDGWRIVLNNEADRIQILFDGKPDEATRTLLKKNGFKWAPSQSAWQRQMTGNAVFSLRHYILPNLPQKPSSTLQERYDG